MTTCAQKERSSTKSSNGVRDASADETNNTKCMESMEKGREHVAKCGSRKREHAGTELLPSTKTLCTAMPDTVEIPNFGE